MSCSHCNKIEHSYKESPFAPLGGYKSGSNNTYQCPYCRQRWYCYNDYYCLWGKVDDDFTWKLLINNVSDIPISIGGSCLVMDGYEEYNIEPTHKPCEEKVVFPEVKLISLHDDGELTPCIQWFGSYEPRNIFNYQFLFPIMGITEKLLPNIEDFVISFIDQIRSWPDSEQREGIANNFNDPEQKKRVALLVSHKYSAVEHGGNKGPLSFMCEIILLGDPNVGVITPRDFFDPTVWEWEEEKYKEKNRATG